ncbi:hypothetical protein [Asanoa iriomotensis]|uniref:Uncharacterized protein n=1 Tax=Asanoa iriomotensis TaxID=234613 RepID=A0ABQ4C6G0_9ACTN|nr:hypothetical protein [Asanoa iriomotensis]GIF58355.1 hypothetical protein Air01nite_44500 [Asanoa iriomotensis]
MDWTDDLSIALPSGRTVAELVDVTLSLMLRKAAEEEVEAVLGAEFGLSADDAELAHDRTGGGLVRASSGIAENCPPADKDPVAWESFQRGLRDPSLIARVYPEFAR